MHIEIEPNPNCKASGLFVFEELGKARPIHEVKVEIKEGEAFHEVTGVDFGGVFVKAHAQKVADSGSGVGYLIYGGAWGIRLRPKSQFQQIWDLSCSKQHGEGFMIYESEDDLVYH